MDLKLKIVFIPLLIVTVLWVGLVIRIYMDSITDERQKADAVIVLGASQWNGKPSPAFRSRLERAYSIFKEGYVKYVVLTGGVASGETISESAVGKKYLVRKGIPTSVILMEEKGRNTFESMKAVEPIIKQKDIRVVILVSHGYHLYRAKQIAKDIDIEKVFISAVPIKNERKKLKSILKESLSYVFYLINPNLHYPKFSKHNI